LVKIIALQWQKFPRVNSGGDNKDKDNRKLEEENLLLHFSGTTEKL
jgi:hypothetical protein